LRQPPFTLRHTQGERGRYRYETETVRAELVEARTANGPIESRVDITTPGLVVSLNNGFSRAPSGPADSHAAEAHAGEDDMSGMEWIALVISTALLVSIGVLAWKVTSH
jgi:hypothetical protein